MKVKIQPALLPLLVVNEAYIFPGFSSKLTVGKKRSLATIAVANDEFKDQLLLVTKKDVKNPDGEKVVSHNDVGVLCQLKIDKKLNSGALVTFKSRQRIKVLEISEKNGVFYGRFQFLVDQPLTNDQKLELSKLIGKILKETDPKTPVFKPENFLKGETVNEFFNLVLQHYPDNVDNFKQKCLETDSLFTRYQLVAEHIKFEPLKSLDLSKLVDRTINRRVKDRLSSQQREFYLREKLRAIREELGETDSRTSEVNRYFKRLENEPFPQHVKKRLTDELERYQALPPISGEM